MNFKWSSFLTISISTFIIVTLITITEGRLRKAKFDGDFEFADEVESKTERKEGKKTWILDPGSDLCHALQCKKKELCLLEDEFTAVCVSKRELHKNGDVIIAKSKLKESDSIKLGESTDRKDYDEIEDDDSDYYDDSNEDFLPNPSLSSSNNYYDTTNDNSKVENNAGSSSATSSHSSDLMNSSAHSTSFKSCSPCPVLKPTFLCGTDNRTYSSLCRLDYHNCVQNTWVTVSCKGFCPCTTVSEEKKRPVESDSERLSRFMEKYKKAVTNLKLQQQQNQQPHQAKKALKYSKKGKNWNVESTNTVLNETTGGDRTSHRNYFNSNDYANGEPALSADVIRDHDRKDRYAKYVSHMEGNKRVPPNKKRISYNDVLNSRASTARDCSKEAFESMRNRLLNWFSLILTDTRKLNRWTRKNNKDPIKFPGYCKLEVQWMFLHLNTDGDGQLSQKELSDLENDRIEKCIKPFIDRCDTDKNIFISPVEWCNCFSKQDVRCDPAYGNSKANCGSVPMSDREINHVDDEDSEIEGSSDGPLEI